MYSFCESELFMDHVGYVNSFQCQMRHWASIPYQTPQTFMRSGSLGRLVHQLVTSAHFRLRFKSYGLFSLRLIGSVMFSAAFILVLNSEDDSL